LDFRNDAVVRVFLYSQDATREIALLGPEMHEGIFAFEAEFEVQCREFG